jgi:hypothetical protein
VLGLFVIMSVEYRRCSFGAVLFALVGGVVTTAWPATAQQPQLGNKVLAGVGIDAGTQPTPGLYIVDRFISYSAHQARDRNGDALPLEGLDIAASGNAFGVAFTTHPRNWPYLNFVATFPLAHISLSIDDPRVSLDRSGLGDIFVQPLKVGWRSKRSDAVAGYAFNAPTGKFEPKVGGVGQGHWTHQFSAGGAAYADTSRTSRASMLATFEVNGRKRTVDIRRGNMLQLQGGAGVKPTAMLMLGVAGYALWQVSDDSGADLPTALRGLRTRVYGLGPEVDLTIPTLRMRVNVRVEWEFGVRSRTDGAVAATSLSFLAWAPSPPTSPAADR